MTFIKLIDSHTIQACPKKGFSAADGRIHTNLPKFYEAYPETAAQDGYLPLVTSEPPQAQEGYILTPLYTVSDGEVLQTWEQTAENAESTIEGRVETLEGAVLELSEIVYA